MTGDGHSCPACGHHAYQHGAYGCLAPVAGGNTCPCSRALVTLVRAAS